MRRGRSRKRKKPLQSRRGVGVDLPVVNDIEIPSLGILLRDQRNVSRETEIVASDIFEEVLTGLIAEYTSRELRFCGMGQSAHEDDLYKKAQRSDPNLK